MAQRKESRREGAAPSDGRLGASCVFGERGIREGALVSAEFRYRGQDRDGNAIISVKALSGTACIGQTLEGAWPLGELVGISIGGTVANIRPKEIGPTKVVLDVEIGYDGLVNGPDIVRCGKRSPK